jgi:hypothetical protein
MRQDFSGKPPGNHRLDAVGGCTAGAIPFGAAARTGVPCNGGDRAMDGEAEESGGRLSVVGQVAAAVCDVAPLEMPRRVCTAFRRAMGADSVALTLASHTDCWQLLHATGALAEHGEETQFAQGNGPTVTASAYRRPVLVADMRTSTWLVASQLAAHLPGVGTVLALPVSLRKIHLGVISLYYPQPGGVDRARGRVRAVRGLPRRRPPHTRPADPRRHRRRLARTCREVGARAPGGRPALRPAGLPRQRCPGPDARPQLHPRPPTAGHRSRLAERARKAGRQR